MRTTILAALGLFLLAFPALAQGQPAAPQRGGCASGFCSTSNAPSQGADQDIDAVESDMKRQLSGQPKPQSQMGMGGQMGGMMGMCPCMRMMAMMMQGRGMQGMGMGGMNMPQMNMPGMNMQDMPGMSPMPEKAPPKAE